MEDILSKLVSTLLGQANSGIVTVMLLAIGYLAWKSHQDHKEHKEEIKEHRSTIDHLQEVINAKIGEERKTLLDIIDKYHDSQNDIKGAIGEIRAVITTITK